MFLEFLQSMHIGFEIHNWLFSLKNQWNLSDSVIIYLLKIVLVGYAFSTLAHFETKQRRS